MNALSTGWNRAWSWCRRIWKRYPYVCTLALATVVVIGGVLALQWYKLRPWEGTMTFIVTTSPQDGKSELMSVDGGGVVSGGEPLWPHITTGPHPVPFGIQRGQTLLCSVSQEFDSVGDFGGIPRTHVGKCAQPTS